MLNKDPLPVQQLFQWQIEAANTIRKPRLSQALHLRGTRHPCFYDLDPFADYNIWIAPNDLWWRNNGNRDEKFIGNEEMPLIRCIRNANLKAKKNESDFVFRGDTLPTWAEGAECSIPFLIAAILADTSYTLRGTPVYDYVCGIVDNGGWI